MSDTSFKAGNELRYISEALRVGKLAGNGPFTKECEKLLEAELDVGKVLLTTSCTDALELAALLLEIRPGDEVIFPSYTFVSTVNAFLLRGARPVFVDIRGDTLNIDEALVEKAITRATRAIVAVHYNGVACELDALLRISRQRGIALVEDNAHGLFGAYRGKRLGSFGSFATLSFHETKNISCGEGGALLINDSRYGPRAEILRDKGTNRNEFLKGDVAKYMWVDMGSSFLPSDILAACLLARLEDRERIQAHRKMLWWRYFTELSEWGRSVGARLPYVPGHCEQSYHMFYLLFPSAVVREKFQRHLSERGVSSAFHYHPLHLSPMGRQWGGKEGDLPVTEQIAESLVRLPLTNTLTVEGQSQAIAAARDFAG